MPSVYDSDWRCPTHGRLLPLTVFDRWDTAEIEHIRTRAEVPLWLPSPLPVGWSLAGLAAVGDTKRRFQATVTAFRGPAPLGGVGEWLFVAEEPGIGLGAGYAGVDSSTSPSGAEMGIPAKIHALGHPMSLWPVSGAGDDRSAYVGEGAGVWFWLIGFPSDAGYAVLEDLSLHDARRRMISIASATERSSRLQPSPR